MIHPWGQHQQEIVQQQRFEVQVKLDGLVVQFNVGHFSYDILKVSLPPRLSWMSHHRQNGIIIFFILIVQENELCP